MIKSNHIINIFRYNYKILNTAKKLISGPCILILITLIYLNCHKQLTQPDNTPVALRIESPAATIYTTGTLQLQAIVELSDKTTEDVTSDAVWSIYPGKAADINDQGRLYASNDSTGIETVQADYQGQTATIEIEVTKRATSLTINPVKAEVAWGGRVQFQALAEFPPYDHQYVTEQADWSLFPGTAGTIDSSGVFTPTNGKYGEETIICQYQLLEAESEVMVRAQLQLPFEMVTIPAGEFVMGNDEGREDQKPAHTVYTDAFEISKYEITNEQYVTYLNHALDAGLITTESGYIIGTKGPFSKLPYARITDPYFPQQFIEYKETERSTVSNPDYAFFVVPGYEDYPVIRLNWYGASAFCMFYGFRLPTEAEWEKACRGGQQLEYGTSDGSISHDLANYSGVGGQDNFENLAPVGSFLPNPYGLYDMSGNAAEYVFDLYDSNYYANSPTENPYGPGPLMPTGKLPRDNGYALCVWRGGSGHLSAVCCQSAFRGYIKDFTGPEDQQLLLGFRVARSIQPD